MVRLSSTEVGFHCSDRILISVIFFSGKYRKVIQCEWSSGLILTVVCWTTSSFVTVALTPLKGMKSIKPTLLFLWEISLHSKGLLYPWHYWPKYLCTTVMKNPIKKSKFQYPSIHPLSMPIPYFSSNRVDSKLKFHPFTTEPCLWWNSVMHATILEFHRIQKRWETGDEV